MQFVRNGAPSFIYTAHSIRFPEQYVKTLIVKNPLNKLNRIPNHFVALSDPALAFEHQVFSFYPYRSNEIMQILFVKSIGKNISGPVPKGFFF